MAGIDNLIPVTMRSKEEAREMARRGGIKSGQTRKMRKTLRDALKTALGAAIPKNSPHYKKVKAQMVALGIHGDPVVQDIPILGMISRAAKDPSAFIAIRDTIGEKPTETYEDLTPQAPIVLGVIPTEKVEKAKADHEKRQLENNKQ